MYDSLTADVLPAAGGQPAPANQALPLKIVKILRIGPLTDDIAVGHYDERRFRMRLEKANGLARLNDQRLVRVHFLQCTDDCLVRRPIPRRASERGVNNEVLWILAHREHILEQSQQPLLSPAPGAKLRS